MGTAYILKSLSNGKFYIGSTNDLNRRLAEHNQGKTKSLRFIRPFKVMFSQEFKTLEEARKIETRLKKFKSRVIIEKIIKDQFIRLGP